MVSRKALYDKGLERASRRLVPSRTLWYGRSGHEEKYD
jgi:hypothetical protein